MLNKKYSLTNYYFFVCMTIAYSLMPSVVIGQYQNEWHLGYHGSGIGLNFNSNPPTVIQSSYNGTGSGSTITDRNGNLLFYTNGDQVWDRNHNLMPNGDGLTPFTMSCGLANSSRTLRDGSIIQPIPFDTNRYYVFTITHPNCPDPSGNGIYYPSSLYYSIVDMRLNGGMGDVVASEKGILIDQGLSGGGICIVPGNNCDYWLLAHTFMYSNDSFYLNYIQDPPDSTLRETGLLAYHVSETGVNTEPVHSVISDIPYSYELHSGNGFLPIVVSPDRTKMMVFNLLGRFDPETAIFSDYFQLFISNSFGSGCYGCSIDNAVFSPSGNKLYVSADPIDGWGEGIYSRRGVFQFDVSEFHYYPIRRSMKVVFSGYSKETLPDEDYRSISQVRLTPYNEVYFFSQVGIGHHYGDYRYRVKMNTITNPEADFDDLIIREDIINMGPDSLRLGWGLPTPIETRMFIDTAFNIYQYLACKQQVLSVPQHAINVRWDDDMELKNRTVVDSGVYRVFYELPEERCLVRVDSFFVTFSKWDSILIKIDTTCVNESNGKVFIQHTTDLSKLAQTINWYHHDIMIKETNNATMDSLTGLGGANYTVVLSLSNGCDTTLNFTIPSYPMRKFAVNPDRITLLYGDSVKIVLDDRFKSYTWSPLDDLSFIEEHIAMAYPKEHASYTIEVKDEYGCKQESSVAINIDYNLPDIIPNAFSPNGDGLNDVFKVEGLTFQKLIEFKVFNRYGQLVHEEGASNKGWDGTLKGEICDAGTYFYLIQLIYPDGRTKHYRGDVILIR